MAVIDVPEPVRTELAWGRSRRTSPSHGDGAEGVPSNCRTAATRVIPLHALCGVDNG